MITNYHTPDGVHGSAKGYNVQHELSLMLRSSCSEVVALCRKMEMPSNCMRNGLTQAQRGILGFSKKVMSIMGLDALLPG